MLDIYGCYQLILGDYLLIRVGQCGPSISLKYLYFFGNEINFKQ